MTFAKPEPREKAKPSRPMPKCTCGHKHRSHFEDDGSCRLCPIGNCMVYVAAYVSVRRQPVARTSAPKKAARKLMPRCKLCAHPASKHPYADPRFKAPLDGARPNCERCSSCPGYSPAIGARQKRRTPAAAVKRIADDLWTRIVHARPEMCEVQQYHAHACVGGYQAMHGIPRTFSATRHLPINGFKGCAGTHKYHSDRPEAWSALLLEAWGLETFRELWALARASQPVDMDATVASLRAELVKIETLHGGEGV